MFLLLFSWKFLKEKPVTELTGDEFLRLAMAEDDKLMVIELEEKVIGKQRPFVVELLQDVSRFPFHHLIINWRLINELFTQDAYSAITNLWNAERVEAGRMVLEKFLIPEMRKELRAKLVADAKAFVVKECSDKFYKMIEVS